MTSLKEELFVPEEGDLFRVKNALGIWVSHKHEMIKQGTVCLFIGDYTFSSNAVYALLLTDEGTKPVPIGLFGPGHFEFI